MMKKGARVGTIKLMLFQIASLVHSRLQYTQCFASTGRIYSRLSWLFMYAKHGVAPDDWVKALQDSGLLSETKVEAAKYSTH